MAISQAIDARGSTRPFVMRKGISVLSDLADGMNAASLALQGAKTVFYVEGNAGLDTNDGKSWDTAFKTLTVALAASHADIAADSRGWAARNAILCKGDALDEDLVLLAQKTDVIGCGSWNARSKCGLVGNHVPTGATASYGTRFFNFFFMANAAGGDIWTLDPYMNSLEFHNCTFYAGSTTAATGAIINAGVDLLGVYNCEFVGRFSDAVIEFGTGDGFRGARIIGNYIEGANQGIHLNSGTTASSGASLINGVIAGNVINTATECIYDEADIAMIIGNMCVTAQAEGSVGDGGIVGEENVSMDNKLSCSDGANFDWPAVEVID
jgi:hypothetical protein